MQHVHAYKLVAYKMTLMYFLVNIYINNQSILYKVNGVVGMKDNLAFSNLLCMLTGQSCTIFGSKNT
jgi:hypothetical protein